jgi:hypothetical protein
MGKLLDNSAETGQQHGANIVFEVQAAEDEVASKDLDFADGVRYDVSKHEHVTRWAIDNNESSPLRPQPHALATTKCVFSRICVSPPHHAQSQYVSQSRAARSGANAACLTSYLEQI